MRRRIVLALCAASGACTGPPDAQMVTVTDSAGIEIVVTAQPAWALGEGWRAAEEPRLRIGLLDGEDPYLLGDVTGVVRLDDGRLVVADGQSRELRFFDSSGVFIKSAGGVGEGPGEFTGLAWMDRCGPGLYAFDRRQQRISTWTVDGEFLETFRLSEPGSDRVPYRSRCGPDGSFLLAGWGELPPIRPGMESEFYTEYAPVWWVSPRDNSRTQLGTYVSSERLISTSSSGAGGSSPHPFGRSVVLALDSTRLLVGSSEGLEVEVWDRSGSLRRVLRGPDEDLLVDEELLADYRGATLQGADSAQRAWLEGGGMPMPPEIPAYVTFLVDSSGNLWVERFTLPGSSETRWGVFDNDGSFLGHVDTPAGFELMDVHAGHLIGVHRDEFDVERVEVYELLGR